MDRIIEILAQELDLPMEEITKSGGGSRLIVGENKEGFGEEDSYGAV